VRGAGGKGTQMNDAPKSAYEIAMEKLRQRDRETGEEGPGPLTEQQKEVIAGIRRKYEARLAEMEILHASKRSGAQGEPEALQKVEEEYAAERRRIEEQREREFEKARAARPRGGSKKGGS
jgi:hypothetical protein